MPGGASPRPAALRRAWRGLLDVLLPAVCPLCGEHPPLPEGGFCAACHAGLRPIEPPHCPVCALPFRGAGPSHPCAQCLRDPPPFRRAAARGLYEGPLRDAVVALKYGGNLAVRAPLCDLFLGLCLETWGPEPPFTAVTAVPCHPETLRRRGLDLPALLARRAAKRWGLPWLPDALEKKHAEVRMAGLSPAARREAARSLFVPRLSLEGPVLLVDDVVTTTATTRAAARACLRAGAEIVEVAALARTPLDQPLR